MKLISTFMLITALVSTSCSLSRRVNKASSNTETKIEVASTQVTRIVEIEKGNLDTIVSIAESRISGTKLLQDIIAGDTLEVDNDRVQGMLIYDKQKNAVRITAKVKQQYVPLKIGVERTKVTEVQTSTNTKENSKQTSKQVLIKSIGSTPILLIILVLLIFLAFWVKKSIF